jgi:hypothetical protein
LEDTIELFKELQEALAKPKGRDKISILFLTWPLIKGEMKKHLIRLERVKSYFMLSLFTEEGFVTPITTN